MQPTALGAHIRKQSRAARPSQRTPEAIGELVAALGDEDEQLRWLAALSLQGIGGGTVIATLKAFMDQAPSAVARGCYAIAREEAERVLGKLTEPGG